MRSVNIINSMNIKMPYFLIVINALLVIDNWLSHYLCRILTKSSTNMNIIEQILVQIILYNSTGTLFIPLLRIQIFAFVLK